MNIKITLITIGTLFIIALLVLFFVFIYPWFALWFGLATLPNPPKPEIAYGEFPFRLTYELNGEVKTVEDTAICEFDGYGERSTAGQSRKWRTSLKSGNDNAIPTEEQERDVLWITLLDLRDMNEVDAFGNKILEIYFFGGNGHYYMGDKLGDHNRAAQKFNYVSYMCRREDGTIGRTSFTNDEAWERYKIRLISWEPSEPIQNTFK